MPKEVIVDTTLSDTAVAAFDVATNTLPTTDTISSLATSAALAAASQVTNLIAGSSSISASSISAQFTDISATLANNNVDLLERGSNLLGSVPFGMPSRVP